MTGKNRRRIGMPKPCTDHKGNRYASHNEMLAAYELSRQTYHNREKAGWRLQDILERPLPGSRKTEKPSAPDRRIPCRDHLDNEFESVKAMCAHWGVAPSTYRYRIKTGRSLEQALTETLPAAAAAETAGHGGPRTAKTCRDHQGNGFRSINEMCARWNVPPATFRHRLKRGFSLEQALTAPPRTDPSGVRCMDHKGRIFPSISAMCEEYGIGRHTFMDRVHAGMSLREALETPPGGCHGEKHGP